MLGVILEQLDFEDIIKKYDGEGVLMYLDPPYVLDDYYYRGVKKIWNIEEHKKLSNCLTKIKSYVIISYYPDDLVDELYPKDIWHRETKDVYVIMNIEKGEKRHKETELLLMNFIPQKQRELI